MAATATGGEGAEPQSLLEQHKAKLGKKSKKELKGERKRREEEEMAAKEERMKQVCHSSPELY